MHDRLEATKRDLETERDALERLKREANGRFEADRSTINQLKDELNKHKARLEESRYTLKLKLHLDIVTMIFFV